MWKFPIKPYIGSRTFQGVFDIRGKGLFSMGKSRIWVRMMILNTTILRDFPSLSELPQPPFNGLLTLRQGLQDPAIFHGKTHGTSMDQFGSGAPKRAPQVQQKVLNAEGKEVLRDVAFELNDLNDGKTEVQTSLLGHFLGFS